jgi:uncharacterized membrane protein
MLPDPLHPAVVHFPIVLVVLLPFFALAAIWAIHRGAAPARAWAVPVALAGALTLSAWAAVASGEADEERVEEAVSESALKAHEAGAERFLVLSGVMLVLAAAGLLRGTIGRSARLVATAGALGLVVAGVQVGHTGGALVYRYGAANAYAGSTVAAEHMGSVPAPEGGAGGGERRD